MICLISCFSIAGLISDLNTTVVTANTDPIDPPINLTHSCQVAGSGDENAPDMAIAITAKTTLTDKVVIMAALSANTIPVTAVYSALIPLINGEPINET